MPPLVTLAGALLVAVSLAGPASAADTSSSRSSPKAMASSTADEPKAAVHHVSGTLESYDAGARTLTVKGTKETWTFDAAEARVWDGSRSVDLDLLADRAGSRVTVKYTDDGGDKRARTVRLAGPRLSHSKAR